MIKFRRIIIAYSLLIVSFVLQSTVFQWISFGGIVPNILIVLVISYGLMRGDVSALFLGFFAGLLVDIFFASFIGLNAFIYMFIGYFAGKFHRIFIPEDIKLPLALIIFSDLLYNFAYYVFVFLLRGRFNFSFYFFKIMIPELVYTMLVSLFIYPLFLLLNQWLDKKDEDGGMKFV